DPITVPIPVVPTCHYMMGGIPANVHGQVLTLNAQGEDTVVPGLYAVGECACVSVHGANRLGGNSLLDLVVFGRAAGLHIQAALTSGHLPLVSVKESEMEAACARVHRWNTTQQGESVTEIRSEMHQVMQRDFGVFRTEGDMQQGLEKLKCLQQRLPNAALEDNSAVFNTARIEVLELDNL